MTRPEIDNSNLIIEFLPKYKSHQSIKHIIQMLFKTSEESSSRISILITKDSIVYEDDGPTIFVGDMVVNKNKDFPGIDNLGNLARAFLSLVECSLIETIAIESEENSLLVDTKKWHQDPEYVANIQNEISVADEYREVGIKIELKGKEELLKQAQQLLLVEDFHSFLPPDVRVFLNGRELKIQDI